MMGSGTSSNEALHREINNLFRQTQKIHKSTLCLKCSIFEFLKCLSHWVALTKPLTRQMSQRLVLCCAIPHMIFGTEEWKKWCAALGGGSVLQKAALPGGHERALEVARVATAITRKPASVLPYGAHRRERVHLFSKCTVRKNFRFEISKRLSLQ